MLSRFLEKVRYAFILLKIGALRIFLEQLRRQICSRRLQIGMVKSLNNYGKDSFECKMKYHLRQASEEDMNEAFQKVKTESKESAQVLLNLKWLYECGCHNWYIARTADTNELCYLQCVIRPEDNKRLHKGLKNRFPKLVEDEIQMEGAYTFEKYRGNKLPASVLFDVVEIYRKKGFKRMTLYIDKDRESQIKATEPLGFTIFRELSLFKTPFFTRIKCKPY